MIGFYEALDNWSEEAKVALTNIEKMQLWLKWAPQVREKDHEMVQAFTDKVEVEVFGDAPSV